MKKINVILLLCSSIVGGFLFANEPDPDLVTEYKKDMRGKDYYFTPEFNLANVKKIVAFAKALEENRSVTDLVIHSDSINKEMANALENALKKNHTVKDLMIAWYGSDDDYAKFVLPALFEALKVNRTITGIYIKEKINPELEKKINAEVAFNNKIDKFLKSSPEMWKKAQLLLIESGYSGASESAFYNVPKEVILRILNLAAKRSFKDTPSDR